MVTRTATAKVAEKVCRAIERAGENPHSVAAATGIPYQTLLRMMRGEETSPFNVRHLDLIAKHLGHECIDIFLVAA